MKRVLFIDGSNLYAGQFELFGPRKFKRHSAFSKKTKTQFVELDYSKLTEKC